ncbi:hypothetical protein CC1G_12338 [Coprinopsis cinerea okayama7|uniref:Uncharacterized protein n=1 Tax=Coprinopsis cinerea (strain Okayama-7 / 130 / ATCC MYA-4618 / FGSC 9003) TaxID=240176 RepID=A8P2R5_COPC7|nr:hypothetical protein CC1G_12338 [Coprinopsis cinerea okayama7\|eukprot:XP_001838388.2 hypothetical protein CC1G_12338 [Coprinopsis cinerea okayama7\
MYIKGAENSSEITHVVQRFVGLSSNSGEGRTTTTDNLEGQRTTPSRRNVPSLDSLHSTAAEYPAHIRTIENRLDRSQHHYTTLHKFYPLWHAILEHWFPSTQGFTISQDWELPSLDDGATPSFCNSLYASLAVLYEGSPLVLVQLHPPMSPSSEGGVSRTSGFFSRRGGLNDSENGGYDAHYNLAYHSRTEMRKLGNALFDRASLWSGHHSLCVISAAGCYWSGVIRSTEMRSVDVLRDLSGDLGGDSGMWRDGWMEAEGCMGPVDDWFGEWDQEVTGVESFEVMEQCFRSLKRGLPVN